MDRRADLLVDIPRTKWIAIGITRGKAASLKNGGANYQARNVKRSYTSLKLEVRNTGAELVPM